MASIRNLKKDINYAFGDVIDAVLIWEAITENHNSEKGKAIIEEAITSYDTFIDKINDKKTDNRSAHLKKVNKEIEEKLQELVKKVNELS